MLRELEDVENFTTDGHEAFLVDRKTQKAVMRSYEVIGEIAKRLPADLLDTHPEVKWQKVKGFRDFLIHNYHIVTLKLVWEAVEDLPNLKAAVEEMLESVLKEEPPLD
jgi:uncharacterized protein with HEPN domain